MFGRKKKRQSLECRALVEDFKKHGDDVYERATEEELERYTSLTQRWVFSQIEWYCSMVTPLSEEENGERVWLNRRLHGYSEAERRPLPVLKTSYDGCWGAIAAIHGAYPWRIWWERPEPFVSGKLKFDVMSLAELGKRKIGSITTLREGYIGPAPENVRDIVDAVLLVEARGLSITAKVTAEAHGYDYFSIIEGKR